MNTSPLHFHSIAELSELIGAGDLSPVALSGQFLARIEELDGRLNAVRVVCRERALAAAREAEASLRAGQASGALHGIPYAAKDLFDVAGLPTTAGTRLLAGNIPDQDATVVDKLAKAGMVLIGKTNTVQLAYSGIGINHDHGTPHNPWHPIPHVPGGSSSGSAVAVAAGLVPMALGTDTGGSVRIPAALCGITGLKTTVGRVSRAGVYPLSSSMDSVGVLARSAEDVALVYDVLQGTDAGDGSTAGVERQDVLAELRAGVDGMRMAFAETVFWEDVDPEVGDAVRACGRVFGELGANVGRMEFPEAEAARQLNSQGLIIAAEAYAANQALLTEHFDELDPVVARRMIKGRDVDPGAYEENVREWDRLRLLAARSLRDVDVLLVPTTRIPALPVAEVDAGPGSYSDANLAYLRNTSIGNILNLCGLSVPCGFTTQGLPIGLMLYGRPFCEDVILRAGHAFQQATDWHRRTPGCFPGGKPR